MKYKNRIVQFLIVVAACVATFYFLNKKSFPGGYQIENISSRITNNPEQDYSGATLVNLDQDPALEIFVSGHGTSNLLLKMFNGELKSINYPGLEDKAGKTFSVTACDIDADGRDELLLLNLPGTGSYTRIVRFKNNQWVDMLEPNNPLTAKLSNAYSAACIDRKGNGKYGLAITSREGPLYYLELVGKTIMDKAYDIGLNFSSKGRSVLGVPGPIGKTNIFVGNEQGANFYFVNNGDGTFQEKAEASRLADSKFNTRGISLIDLNHDDMADAAYGNHIGPLRLLKQNSDGSFTDVTPENLADSYAVNAAVVGDFNLDGYEDLYLNNIGSKNKLFARYEDKWYRISLRANSEKKLHGISTIAADLDGNGSYEILNTHGDGKPSPLTLYTVKAESQWIKFNVKFANGGVPRGATLRLRTNKRDQLRTISSGSGRFANYDNTVTFGLLKNENVISLEVTLPSGAKVAMNKKMEMSKINEMIIDNY